MNDLKQYKFNELYEMGSGISTTPAQAGHGAPFVSFSTIFNNVILPEELPDKMDTSVDEQEKYSVKKGDILLTRTSETLDELAMSSVAVKDYPNATFSGFAKRLRPLQDDITYDKFMAFYLRSPYFRKIVDANAIMTLRASLNEDIFSYIKLWLPDYDTQTKIGDFFWDIEQKIRNNKKVLSELESMANLLYNYWFIQFDFPDAQGKPYKASGGKMVWNEELKRSVPDGWKYQPYSSCVESINTGLNPRDNFKLNTGGTIRYLTVKNLTTDGTIDFASCDCIDEEARTVVHNRSDIQVGDILFASISPLGRCYIIPEEPKDWDINESVFSIRPNRENMTSNYLYLTFMSDFFVRLAEGNSAGSVFKGIRISELLNLKTIIPPKEVLDAFDTVVNRLFELKTNAVNENQELTGLRDFLLPMLMNGQVKFRENN